MASWRGDLYVGREAALLRIISHVTQQSVYSSPLIITGQPGSGKSTVLAKAVTNLEAAGYWGLAVHGRDCAVSEISDAVARACGIKVASEAELVQAVSDSPPERLVVAVDALDEMRTSRDRDEAALLLRDLAMVESIRVIVATRSLASEHSKEGAAWQRSDLIQLLCAGRPWRTLLLDLDDDEFFSRDDLIELIELILSRSSLDRPLDTPGAWHRYREDDSLRRRLALRIQERAGRNFLTAAMSASLLASEEYAVDPHRPGFKESDLPHGVGEALDKFINRLGDQDREHVRDLLLALSYGRGSGLSNMRWVHFARALRESGITEGDVSRLRSTPVADYLLESSEKDGRILTALFHRALGDYLQRRRDTKADESVLCDLMLQEAEDSQWLDGYVRRFLPSHALASGRANEFLDIPDFIAYCYPSSVSPVARSISVSKGSEPAAVYRLALPSLGDNPGENAGALEVAARVQGAKDLAYRLQGRWSSPLVELVCVNATPSQVPMSVFMGHARGVRGVAVLPWPGRDLPVVVTTSGDATARVWDPFDPQVPELARFEGHRDWVGGVAVLPWPGRDLPVVVTTSGDATARVWDPFDPQVPELARFEGHRDWVGGVAVLPWPGRDLPVVVTTSGDATARVWDPFDPQVPELARFEGHRDWVGGVAVLPWPGRDLPVVVTTSGDATARVWDPFDPQVPELARFEGHRDWVGGVAVLPWPGRDLPVVVTTSGDATARVWDPFDPQVPELARFEGHRGRVRSIHELGWRDGTSVCATTSDDATVQIWRASSAAVESLGTYDAHSGAVHDAVCISDRDTDNPLVVSVSGDATVHVWAPHRLLTEPSEASGHSGRVRSATWVEDPHDSDPWLVTTSNDGKALVWKVRSDQASEVGCFDAHDDWVRDIDILPWPGFAHDVVATASGDGTVQIWNPATPERDSIAVFNRHTAGVRSVRLATIPSISVPLLITASADHTVKLWNPYGVKESELCSLRHPDVVRKAILVEVSGEPVVVAASGSEVFVWELNKSWTVPSYVFQEHEDWVRDLAVWREAGRLRICSVSSDTTLRIWEPFVEGGLSQRYDGHTDWIWGVTTARVHSGLAVVTVSADGTARFWDPDADPDASESAERGRLQLLSTGLSVRSRSDRLVITTSRGFLLYRLKV